MRNLSLLIALIITITVFPQSPHGKMLKNDCIDCHSPEQWTPVKKNMNFDHNSTGFPLLGQHKTITCGSCHTELVFENTPNQCISCHKDVHQNSVGHNCEKCHSPVTWIISNINELHQKSRFPLFGVHAKADCGDCHQNYSQRIFEPIGVNCIDCHQNDFLSTQNPNHLTAGFSTDCLTCHTVVQKKWSEAVFAHDFFPLTGGHKVSNCYSCHSASSFKGLSTDCYSCHKSDYENTINPKHQQAGFSTGCQTCHTVNSWVPANFNHSITQFPLTGKHINVGCNSCHITTYTGTPKDCYSCHKTNYEGAQNPNHLAAKFPVDCIQCHSTNGWSPASFNHDQLYFPVYSGKHKGKWSLCTDCHSTPSNFSKFSCIDCHEHRKSEMDKEHEDVTGYIYESSACLNCHPNGNADKVIKLKNRLY